MKTLVLTAVLLIALSALAEDPDSDYFTLSLDELINVEIYTASRRWTRVEEAPAAVTVITRDEIRRRGYKTLDEALSRVVGFHSTTSNSRQLISNRGFVQDVNNNYLLLLDGHALNENAWSGIGQIFIYPTLANVARIEIIRGPGSTLWGSDAAAGIIHVVTMTGAELDVDNASAGATSISLDYEFDHERLVANVMYGKTLDSGGLMLSFDTFESDPEPGTFHVPGDDGLELANSVYSHFDYEPSYNLYFKASHGDWGLKAQWADLETRQSRLTTATPAREGFVRWDRKWAEATYGPQLSPNTRLEARLYYDDTRHGTTQFDRTDGSELRERANHAHGFGAEAMVRRDTDDHAMLAGIFWKQKKLQAEVVTDLGNGRERIAPVPEITDQNWAFFVEDSYTGLDGWRLTIGARMEHNSPRDDELALMPRASVFREMGEKLYGKYAFNSGFVRPTLVQTRGGVSPIWNRPGDFAKGADHSQKSQSHDLQLGYKSRRTTAIATVYYARMDDLILWGGNTGPISIDGQDNVFLWETNLNDIEQKGLELECTTGLTRSVVLYGSYALADAGYDRGQLTFENILVAETAVDFAIANEDLTATGTPRHSWHLGLDWDATADLALNLHYRGWQGVWSKRSTAPTRYHEYGAEHFLDANLCWRSFVGGPVELGFYIKNLGDNRGPIPMSFTGGHAESPNGRQFGIQTRVEF